METKKKSRRISTGIEKLDNHIVGFPVGRTVLVTGDAGTGKTIFALQFLNACCKAGMRTALIATEEEKADLVAQASSFGWNLENYVKDKVLTIVEVAIKRVEEVEARIQINLDPSKGGLEQLLEQIPDGTEVLVIDSIGSHTSELKPRAFKDRLDVLVFKLNTRNITSLFVLDSATSRDFNDLALFSVYGAIVLMKRENPYTGRRERVMDIVKMRNTSTPIQLLQFDMTPHGIEIATTDEPDDANGAPSRLKPLK